MGGAEVVLWADDVVGLAVVDFPVEMEPVDFAVLVGVLLLVVEAGDAELDDSFVDRVDDPEVLFELVEWGRSELPVDALFELEALEALEEALDATELLEPEPDEVLVEPLHGFA